MSVLNQEGTEKGVLALWLSSRWSCILYPFLNWNPGYLQ